MSRRSRRREPLQSLHIATVRQGRVERPDDSDGAVSFQETGRGSIIALLGVVTVGEIMPCPVPRKGAEFLWACFLPPFSTAPRPAGCLTAARGALAFQVRQWMEAACVVGSAALAAKLAKQRNGR